MVIGLLSYWENRDYPWPELTDHCLQNIAVNNKAGQGYLYIIFSSILLFYRNFNGVQWQDCI